MGLLDCVSDRCGKYPVSPPPSSMAPMQRGLSGRRSMGLFASNTSLKSKDVTFWQHRLLCFLYKGEGREDVGALRMPLKQLGYNTIGDFIRDIPLEIYDSYKSQLNPDTGLRKDYKIIWERDGIAEPGMLKWEGSIEGQRCMGLQLDRKKAVPFGIHDGKGLFYCKPGHRALVPVDEVFPYKSFLRQFVGMPPRKDSMPLNLLPGRSSVRVAVAKQYKPGHRVFLPGENKWATILWTGKIEGEWVVDLVYDPDKPATGRMASPDEQCMSRSLSMAEFIDEVGSEQDLEKSKLPNRKVPPPPPTSPPPQTPDLEDDVFIALTDTVSSAFKDEKEQSESSADEDEQEASNTEEDEVSSEVEEEEDDDQSQSDEIHSTIEPPIILESELSEGQFKRTHSEPGPDLSNIDKTGNKKITKQPPPLISKPTHKAVFNLASLGLKSKSIKAKEENKPKPAPRGQVPSPSKLSVPSKKEFSFFGKPKAIKKTNQSREINVPKSSLDRRDPSRSPVYSKKEKSKWSEVPVDVPINLRSPKSSEPETPTTIKEKSEPHEIHQEFPASQRQIPKLSDSEDDESIETSADEQSISDAEVESNRHNDIKETHKEEVSVTVDVERPPSECSSDTTPPYSPVIKDVGFQARKKKPEKSSGSGFSFGSLFSSKKKSVPKRDYHEEAQPPIPIRKESLGHKEPEKQQNNDADDNHSIEVQDQLGDQDGLVLDSLEVHDDQPPWSSPPPENIGTPKRAGSKGKSSFSFGFKRRKSTEIENGTRKDSDATIEMVTVISDTPRYAEPKIKKSSFRESFNKKFSFNKSVSDFRDVNEKPDRPTSLMYVDNNEAIGAKPLTKPKSKSTSVLVDIQPWNERRGHKSELYEMYDSPDEYSPTTPSPSSPSGKSVPALIPKQPDPEIPKHRMFTTPIGLFGFGSKSNDSSKPKKKSSFKGPKPSKSPRPIFEYEKVEPKVESPPPPPPKTGPPKHPPPPVPISAVEEASSPRQLKSALKQRKEIDAIPNGLKIGDRVIWYDGKLPILGFVNKLYKDGTDKYTAVVKFDRAMTSEPLSLMREGDGYVVTVEELLTPEFLGLPLVTPPQTPLKSEKPKDIIMETKPKDEDEEVKSPTVRFVPSPEPPVVQPVIQINDELGGDEDEDIPPPFQEEEIEIACGVRRGIPSRDRASCLETVLFAMFYSTNCFDTSLLYGSSFEKDKLTRDIRILLRDGVVHPLRQSGFCEFVTIQELKALLQKTSPDFNSMSTDAEIMTFILFERALKLGKFISYSNNVTDYLHQLVLDPKDLSKSETLQQLLETSLKQMDNSKLKTAPSPSLIIEIPRANDKFVQYEAVIPNLTINVSHLLENGPKLCICGMVGKYECLKCTEQSGDKALVYCDNCNSMADQIHFQLSHKASIVQVAQSSYSMDLVAVICIKDGHYTAFVKCGSQRVSPWLFYDAAEFDNPKVSLEQNLGMWVDRLEKYPGKYHEAFVHPLLSHFLANSSIYIYQPREKSSLV